MLAPSYLRTFLASSALLALTAFSTATAPAQTLTKPGDTRVATWKGDKAAAFLLMYDDGWPSHFQVALPEMVKRGMVGTFYICPDKGEFKQFINTWEEEFIPAGMVFGNHTMTHKGIKDPASAEYEIGDAATYIRMVVPKLQGKLVSFGQPGVGKGEWEITGEELKALLKKHLLISRPTFVGHGANYHLKTTEEYLALADKAIAERGMEYVIFHGLERTEDWGYQDMWAVKQDVFIPFLDGLKERSDRGDLWITDHISQHQYATERDSAKVKIVEASDRGIRLEMRTDADPQLYDYPLTLVTRVPTTWTRADVKQGETITKGLEAKNGAIMYEAVPNGTPVEIRRGQ